MNENNICKLCVSYVAGDLSLEQRESFEHHLHHCTSCLKDVDELRDVWSILPLTMDELEVPTSLKEDTLKAVFSSTTSHKSEKNTKPRRWLGKWTNAAAVVVIIGVLFNVIFFQWQNNERQDMQSFSSAVVELYSLSSVGPFDGRGTACILQQGDKKQLVIYSWGLEPTQIDEVYQVWYLNDGVRRNAGTFKVDENGYGVLTFELDKSVTTIEDIGVTLEPDATGTEPRGKKVLGT